MSASIHTPPPTVALSQELLQVTLATNNVTSARARLDVQLSGTGPGADQVWTLGFSGKFMQFTFKALPDSTGLQLPISTGAVTKRYVHKLAEALTQHEWVSEQFDIHISDLVFSLSLISRFDTPLSIVTISPVTGFVATTHDATSPYLKTNLSASLKVVSRKGREIAKLTGDYGIFQTHTGFEGRSDFDIGKLFDLAPHLPNDATLNPNTAFTHGIAFRAYAQYFLRYADKYGITPVAEALTRSNSFCVLHGRRAASSIVPFSADAKGIFSCQIPFSSRRVTRHQPSYFYFFPTKRLPNVVVNVRAWLNNGTHYDLWLMDVHALRANRLYYYRTGFDQLKLASVFSVWFDTSAIVAYEWQLVDGITQVVYVSQRYDLESCRYDSLYLAYANGLGGIDTLHVRGGYSQKVEAERTLVHYTNSQQPTRNGTMATMDATTQQVWDIQTGLVTPQYASQLQQLLIGDVWLIDTNNNRFLKLIADTKNIETRPKNGGMVSLALTFKAAWTD